MHVTVARSILESAGLDNDLSAAHDYGVSVIRAAQVLREIERSEKRKRIEMALHVESGR